MRPGPVTELGWGPVDIIDDRDPLLVVWLISTIGFVAAADGVAQVPAGVAAALLTLTLTDSVTHLVPLQQRLLAGVEPRLDTRRRTWYRGHLVRTALALIAFVLLALAVEL